MCINNAPDLLQPSFVWLSWQACMYHWLAPAPSASAPDHEVYIPYHHHFPGGRASERTVDEIIKVTSSSLSAPAQEVLI